MRTRAQRRAERRKQSATRDALHRRWQQSRDPADYKAWVEWVHDQPPMRGCMVTVWIIGLVVAAIIVVAFLSASDPDRNRDRSPADRKEFCQRFPEECAPPEKETFP
jgi:hypothetical protein